MEELDEQDFAMKRKWQRLVDQKKTLIELQLEAQTEMTEKIAELTHERDHGKR